jgi:hypothetical protein
MYFKPGDPTPIKGGGGEYAAIGTFVLDPKTGKPVSLGAPESGAAPGNPQTGISNNGIVINEPMKVGTSGRDLVAAGGTYKNSLTIKNVDSQNHTLYLSFNKPVGAVDFSISAGESLTLPFGPLNDLYGMSSGTSGDTCDFTIIGA